MVRILLVSCIVLMFSGILKAQTAYPDLIVLKNKDTIRCKFRKIDRDESVRSNWIANNQTTLKNNQAMIFYWHPGDSGKVLRAKIWKSDAALYVKDFYARREAGPGGKIEVQPISYYESRAQRRRPAYLAFQLGYAHWIGQPNRSFTNWAPQYKRSRGGIVTNFSAGYMVTPMLGIGGRWEYFKTPEIVGSDKVTESLFDLYIAFDVSLRIPLNPMATRRLFAQAGAGYEASENTMNLPNPPLSFVYRGTGWARHLEVGYWQQLSPLVGIRASAAGHFGHVNNDNGSLAVSRVGATAALVFTF